MQPPRANEPFRICGSCRRAWSTWQAFLLDPGLRLLGLQSELAHPEANLLVFEHECGSSLSVLARRLRPLLLPPAPDNPPALLMGTDQCRRHCLRLQDLELCDAPCRNARDRRLIQAIQTMRRGESPP